MIQFPEPPDAMTYGVLKDRSDLYEQARKELFPGICCFTPEMLEQIVQKAGIDRAPLNSERSLMEVFRWFDDPPEKYMAYVTDQPAKGQTSTERYLTTWTGDILGSVILIKEHKRRGRFTIRVKGRNGKEYSGTYYGDSGSYCRIKRIK